MAEGIPKPKIYEALRINNSLQRNIQKQSLKFFLSSISREVALDPLNFGVEKAIIHKNAKLSESLFNRISPLKIMSHTSPVR